jgi:hypothetical protein
MVDPTTLNDEELHEFCEWALEIYGDLNTQYRSEIILYGDASSSAIHVAEALQEYEAAKAELDRRFPPLTVADPADDIIF